jgi:alkanesulfonate monooxygenase SsuD/methylene tetrahydromethanopterin reductase-like flavin-dependent oxidoreductase (luciferase family)
VFAAAVAARTERIQIGTDVLLAPLHEPVRLAEDVAVVDLLCRGRLVLGLGQGWRPEEFEGLRVPLRGRHLRFEDTIATLRQAWSEALVTGGETVPYPGMSVSPKPAQAGGPPIWIGGITEPAVRRAGRIGDGFIANWGSPQTFARQTGWVREELERGERAEDGFTFAAVLPVFVSEERDAWERVRDAFHHYDWKYADVAESRGRTGPPVAAPPLTAERGEKLRKRVLLGTPDELVDLLAPYHDVAGDGFHLIAEFCWPALDPALRDESMAAFAERVAPQLRSA